jgi:hypothetical protein
MNNQQNVLMLHQLLYGSGVSINHHLKKPVICEFSFSINAACAIKVIFVCKLSCLMS